uniref:Prepilin-type N-terminal cleavage/methylation domain-containing protein n=1 Tax=Escherichia coli TaxID=562 RepID=A0A1U9XG46_ECOLX|nr:hypothetical protein H13_00043 [Escherichia coli]
MKKTDKGVSLLEVLLVIGIMVMVIPKVYENIENHLNNVRCRMQQNTQIPITPLFVIMLLTMHQHYLLALYPKQSRQQHSFRKAI